MIFRSSGIAFVIYVAIALLFSPHIFAQYDIEAEIAKVKKETSRVRSERQKNRQDFLKDKREYAAYRERIDQRKSLIINETDSIKTLIKAAKIQSDSLSMMLSIYHTRAKEQALVLQQIQMQLTKSVSEFLVKADALPPLVKDQSLSSLRFLESELKSGSVDNIEALNRLLQIVRDIETFCSDIQVLEGVSPIPELRSSVYRLRIGAFFEALVDNKGQRCAVWLHESDAPGSWITHDDAKLSAALLQAVRIREGKTLPVLVELPIAKGDAAREVTK